MIAIARPTAELGSTPAPAIDRAASSPERWVDLHGNHLLRYAQSRVRDAHVAEELVQETLIAALDARRGFSGLSTERTWLIGILRHKMVDHFRRASRERSVADVEELPDPDEHRFDAEGRWLRPPEAWQGDPERAVLDADFRAVLGRCLDELPRNLADAFVLREIEELPTEQVCDVLGITANNLWVRLHRARAQLRRGLEERWFHRTLPAA